MIDLASIPDQPGCYLFKDQKNIIIYIGKARSLKKRVRSYFSPKERDPKTERLVEHIHTIDTMITDTEVEALILENTLIKRHQPKYNINLKDAKNYAYIRVTDEEFPRLTVARRRTGKGEYFGPFVSAAARDYVLTALNKAFRFRTCRRFPKKPCLRYHIKLCDAPCTGGIMADHYGQRVANAKMILKGRAETLIQRLKREMKELSEQLQFEQAIEIRNRIAAVERLKEKQKMDRQKQFNEDVVNYVVRNGTVYLVQFNIHRGVLENKQEFQFEETENFFEEFLVQYYSEHPVPREIILPEPVEESVIEFLRGKREGAVQVTVPLKGEKRKLVDLVMENIKATQLADVEKLEDLRRALSLQSTPTVIECFDISHLAGTATVASMVQFRNGAPDKSNYRRFKIKTVAGIDDFASIAEVVRRRYARLQEEQNEMPDLVVIDGGAGQLNAALAALRDLGLALPIVSIAKKFEEIYVPGTPEPTVLRLSRKRKGLQLIQRIRDDAHRFAITYNRLLRKKSLFDDA